MTDFKIYIQNLSLKKKIRCIVLLCITLLSAAALMSIRLIASSYQKVLYQSVAGSLSYSSRDIINQMESLNTMSDMFLADTTIQDNLNLLTVTDRQTQRTEASRQLYNTLNEYYYNFRKHYIRYMSLYQDDFATHTYMAAITPLPASLTAQLRLKAQEGGGATVWVTDYCGEYGLFMVKEIRRIEHLSLQPIGILIVNIDSNSLIQRSTSISGNYGEAGYLLYDHEKPIYDSLKFTDNPDFDPAVSLPSSYGRLKQDGKDYFYVHSLISDWNWDYICSIPYDNITKAVNFSRNLCLAMIFTAVLCSFTLSSRLIASLSRHFDMLVTKMQYFGDGNSEPLTAAIDYSHRKDEVAILHTQFDQMVKQVNELIRSNYVNEILRKEAQLKALETQINPHFLYNTLESINWRAKALGAKDISSMAECLGTLLRITLDQTNQQFPLYRELELIRSYMTIQQFRYEERLEYEIIVPDNLLHYEVLKLTLQPLVENAIRYGLEENTETCRIAILAEASEGRLYLYVKNNGSAFEENTLAKLKSHEIKPHGFGIGLLNIHERLQLTYGNNYGLKLCNEGELAVARIAFPLPYPPIDGKPPRKENSNA